MIIRHLALVSETDTVSLGQIARVSAALQKQVMRDLAPIWEIRATVDPFASLDDVPLGYWPLIVVADAGTGRGAGVHLDRQGQPLAVIEAGTSWSLAASHEALEMLVDPFGSRLVAGRSPDGKSGRVEFLVEVCDPVQDIKCAYQVNEIVVSDFYTPHYFDPVKSAGVRYSFTGSISGPREVAQGGYLSWYDPVTRQWLQKRHRGRPKRIKGVTGAEGGSLRSVIDRASPELSNLSRFPGASLLSSSAGLTPSLMKAQSQREELCEKWGIPLDKC